MNYNTSKMPGVNTANLHARKESVNASEDKDNKHLQLKYCT